MSLQHTGDELGRNWSKQSDQLKSLDVVSSIMHSDRQFDYIYSCCRRDAAL